MYRFAKSFVLLLVIACCSLYVIGCEAASEEEEGVQPGSPAQDAGAGEG